MQSVIPSTQLRLCQLSQNSVWGSCAPGLVTTDAPRGPREAAQSTDNRVMSLLKLQTSHWPLPPPLLLLLLLLLGTNLLASAGRDKGAAGRAVASPAGGSSGRFVSPEGHACSWQLLRSAPGHEAASELALRCQGPGGARHQCAYRGEPGRCADYAARRAHYWKQVLGALRKKRLPCLDPAPLKARLCAGKRGHGAELRLVSHGLPIASSTASGIRREPQPSARNRGRPRGRSSGPSTWVPPPPSLQPKGKPSEKTKGGRRKVASDHSRELPLLTRPDPDGLEENAKLTETYCAEKWHSLCNFFVNFWNG